MTPIEAAMAAREQAAVERHRGEKAHLDAQADEHERRQAAWDALTDREQVARQLAGQTHLDASDDGGTP